MLKGVKSILIISTALLVAVMSSCLKPQSYPDEPVISFTNMAITPGDSLIISIDFTDGDGDVGLAPNETNPPYDTSNRYYFNLFIEYWEWNHDIQDWQRGVNAIGDEVHFNARVPVLTPEGKNKALKGTIQETITPPYSLAGFSNYGDTIKYRIQLVDRALRESNWVWTPEIWNGVVQPTP